MRPDIRGSDTMSEVSDGGTVGTRISGQGSGYGGSREDLQELLVTLGLTDVSEIHEDRFRVDRRKLEHMLLAENDISEPADTFFQRIMDETNTSITWPSRLKIGAKSKKDPHVRVAGRPEDVKAAKSAVMEVLDTRSNRVTMKMDVSYTDHSHIIGKGGQTIKRVMDETSCHIHFPDSNRSNPTEKSNQVSIAGEIEGVEQARQRVRDFTPLIFSFELPRMECPQLDQDPATIYIQMIEEKYKVQVMFRTRPKLYATLVVVKGCEWEVSQVKEATMLLMNHMCGTLVSHVMVHMSMEISPQHHTIVLGKNKNNLKMIMQCTATQIMYLDATDPNTPSLKKSNFNITGLIHNVYLARQQLLGSLPLVLMFDLPEEISVDADMVTHLQGSLDVLVNVRHKIKQGTLSVVIKGIERNASDIYEARKQLLRLDEPRVYAEIPATYHMPNAPAVFALRNDDIKSELRRFPGLLSINTGYNGQSSFPPSPLNSSPGHSPCIPSPSSGGFPMPWNAHFNYPGAHMSHPMIHPQFGHMMTSQQQLLMHHLNAGYMPHLSPSYLKSNMSSASSGYSSMGQFSSSSQSLASDSRDCNAYTSLSSNGSSMSSPAISPRAGSGSPVQGVSTDVDSRNLTNMLSNLVDYSGLATGSENTQESGKLTSDYDGKKLLAQQALKSKVASSKLRVPTSTWAGYGFSQSSPTPEQKNQSFNVSEEAKSHLELWKNTNPVMRNFSSAMAEYGQVCLGASNYLEATPRSVINDIVGLQAQDLPSLLTDLGLDKYIQTFTSHEIDLETFTTLVENDLREIGVAAFGARRKMLVAIAEMNKNRNPFPVAPGAERKNLGSSVNLPPSDKW